MTCPRENGMPVVVTGKGETIQDTPEQCYSRVENIAMPNRYYRDDIGERWIDGEGDRPQAWGYFGPQSPEVGVDRRRSDHPSTPTSAVDGDGDDRPTDEREDHGDGHTTTQIERDADQRAEGA
ncbi:hypothetical protein [Halolamina salifodinae]|uniref:Uncharacterized protein n=1 Tax=Halolamina salifodinae TaxID=1202767 RepID=A0A8T4H1K4_9EURY|nr:hypothetical protein [Halolamina salifodinae]